MNDGHLLKTIGEGITELKTKYNGMNETEKENIYPQLERLVEEYKRLFIVSLKKNVLITENDLSLMEGYKKQIDNLAEVPDILELINNIFMIIFNLSNGIINTVNNFSN